MAQFYCSPRGVPVSLREARVFEAESAAEAARITARFVYGAAVDNYGIGMRVTVYVSQDGTDWERHLVALDVPEPKCKDGGPHDWRMPAGLIGPSMPPPGTYRSAEGRTITIEVCSKCGAYRHVVTGPGLPPLVLWHGRPDETSLQWIRSITIGNEKEQP